MNSVPPPLLYGKRLTIILISSIPHKLAGINAVADDLGARHKLVMEGNREHKSCAPCHSGKRKCDGQRPCARCTRLNRCEECVDYSSSPRKRRAPGEMLRKACTGCQRAKTKCSATLPCTRCVKKGLNCNSSMIDVAVSIPGHPPHHQQQQPHPMNQYPQDSRSQFIPKQLSQFIPEPLNRIAGDYQFCTSALQQMTPLLPMGQMAMAPGSQAPHPAYTLPTPTPNGQQGYPRPVPPQTAPTSSFSSGSPMQQPGVLLVEFSETPPGSQYPWTATRRLNARGRELLELTPEQLQSLLEFDPTQPVWPSSVFVGIQFSRMLSFEGKAKILESLVNSLYSGGHEVCGDVTFNLQNGSELPCKYEFRSVMSPRNQLQAVVFSFAPHTQ